MKKSRSSLRFISFSLFSVKIKEQKSNLLLRWAEHTVHLGWKNVFVNIFLLAVYVANLSERPRSSNVDIFRHKNAVAREWNKQCQSRMIDFWFSVDCPHSFFTVSSIYTKTANFFDALLCLNADKFVIRNFYYWKILISARIILQIVKIPIKPIIVNYFLTRGTFDFNSITDGCV